MPTRYKVIIPNLVDPTVLRRSTDGTTLVDFTVTGKNFDAVWFDEYDPYLNYGLGVLAGTAGTRRSIYKTEDGGDTWAALTALTEDYTDGGTSEVGALMRIPTTNTLLASQIEVGTGARIARSTNGGTSWSTIVVGGAVNRTVERLAFWYDQPTASILFTQQGTNPNAVWRSTDDGASWTSVLTVNQQAGPMTFIGGTGFWTHGIVDGATEVWRTLNGGASWANVLSTSAGNGGPWDANFKYRSGPALLPVSGDWYLVLRDNVGGSHHYRSIDGGASWSVATPPGTFPVAKIGSLVGVPGTSSVFFCDRIGGNFIALSTDDGVTWGGAGEGHEIYVLHATLARALVTWAELEVPDVVIPPPPPPPPPPPVATVTQPLGASHFGDWRNLEQYTWEQLQVLSWEQISGGAGRLSWTATQPSLLDLPWNAGFDTATLFGTVTDDDTGLPISGATVSAAPL